MPDDSGTILEQFVDELMPLLTPYESVVYLCLLRKQIEHDGDSVLVGQRTLANLCGTSANSHQAEQAISQKAIRKTVLRLEAKGCLRIGQSGRTGTEYSVTLPSEIPMVAERRASEGVPEPGNHYRDPALRAVVFERDQWTCRFCGTLVDSATATLDHLVPSSRGGSDEPDNLATACHPCNSIKSGKTLEEAAPLILASVAERTRRAAAQPQLPG